MALPNKSAVLKGAVIQDTSSNYIYILPETGINSVQNALNTANFEEVFIDCFSSVGTQNVTLPKISSFRRGFSPKVYVCNKGNNSITIAPTTSVTELNEINFGTNFTLLPNQSAYLHIVNNNNWALWVTPTPAP